MMSGPKRNPDALNTIGVVVVGICGAVLVYVSIVALQAFYMNDTSEVQTMADYGGQETVHQSLRATQTNVIEDCGANTKPEAGKQQTYRIPIKYAIKLVADDAKVDPSNLVPTQGRSDKPTILPVFGRPKVAPKPNDNPPGGTTPAGKEGAVNDVPMTPTGGQGPGGGQPPGQSPVGNPAGPPTGTGAADPNPTGAQTPSPGGQNKGGTTSTSPRTPSSTPLDNKAGSAPSPGGNPPTPNPKPGASDPKGGTTAPKATGSAAPAKAGSAAKGSNK
jgi:hypothetical protein